MRRWSDYGIATSDASDNEAAAAAALNLVQTAIPHPGCYKRPVSRQSEQIDSTKWMFALRGHRGAQVKSVLFQAQANFARSFRLAPAIVPYCLPRTKSKPPQRQRQSPTTTSCRASAAADATNASLLIQMPCHFRALARRAQKESVTAGRVAAS